MKSSLQPFKRASLSSKRKYGPLLLQLFVPAANSSLHQSSVMDTQSFSKNLWEPSLPSCSNNVQELVQLKNLGSTQTAQVLLVGKQTLQIDLKSFLLISKKAMARFRKVVVHRLKRLKMRKAK